MYEEIPHGTAVQIESMEFSKTNRGEDIVDIGVVIICEKQSHKGMIIGKQGSMLKKIGKIAREEMEAYFEETRFEAKPSLWQRIKNSKLVRTISYITKIRIRLDVPALPEGRDQK